MGSIRPASPLLLLAAIAASATPPVARFVPTRRNATAADTRNPRVFLAMTAAAEDEEAKLLPYVLAHYAALGIPRRNFIVTLHARPGGEGAYAAMAATLEAAGCRGHPRGLCGAADASRLRCLNEDPEAAAHAPNKRSRSPEVADLGSTRRRRRLRRVLRRDHGALPFPAGESWATPYALSIMGEPQTRNCPFGTGNGYGDGRAVSVGEIKSPKDGRRYELQLKGGGQTPFCRGADGRAVLRSSLREFLASEAMHFLGAERRALSLVVSGGETTRRPWYSGRQADVPEISEDDPRLAQFPLQLRRQLIRQLQQQGAGGGDPDVMVEETCAITCRVAPSFVRVGHVDHFARRAGGRGAAASAKREHKLMVQHAIAREYPDLLLEHRDETDATMLALVGDDELRTAALAFAARRRWRS
ncbi:hypothetical protein JL721_9368 [Aureococcus anophagefferens]|nr:hypothetical protein JL721_9368 [Aureococcus anophagefferens]